MGNFSEKVNFIWSIADLIRDSFKRSKYQDVILPFTVLRRIDSVLAPTKPQVLRTLKEFGSQLDNPEDLLRSQSGYAFYNTSLYDFDSLLGDHENLAYNLRNYINLFSDNMHEVIRHFDFDNTIKKLDEANLLYQVMERFKNIDLHPDSVSNSEMGLIFEELIRKFNEASNENPGEHFTPREVIRLMVSLLMTHDTDELKRPGKIVHVYDPCCGTGGMLTIAKNRIDEMNPQATVRLYGQEVNPETFAVAKSDLYMLSEDGKDAENIAFGSTLSDDKHRGGRFDYILANPPYGKEWKMDKMAVDDEANRGHAGRFGAGTPRISDGQMLFLQHMISKRRPSDSEGSRIAIVMNGSPLFTGDAGSGESEIRRWILENDWLDTIIALPEQLFYNTGISTYVWILSNKKTSDKQGKVQLIDASSFWVSLHKNLGDKRREISDEQIADIVQLYRERPDNEFSKLFDRRDFGYRKVTIERPLQLNFQASSERIARLDDERAFQNLAKSKKRDPLLKAEEEAAGRREQARIKAILTDLPATLFKSRDDFDKALTTAARAHSYKFAAPVRKAILSALSERDESAAICRKKGQPEADSSLRDFEYVPLSEDVHAYFAREVTPHVPDAWINSGVVDAKDRDIGRVGYEINFNRYFYQYQPPRPLDEINADISGLEREILAMLREVVG